MSDERSGELPLQRHRESELGTGPTRSLALRQMIHYGGSTALISPASDFAPLTLLAVAHAVFGRSNGAQLVT